ncbi:TPA: hypothetical protein ACS72F_001451 [Providencia alcalifaciens]
MMSNPISLRTFLLSQLIIDIIFILLVKFCSFVNENIMVITIVVCVINIGFIILISGKYHSDIEEMFSFINKFATTIISFYSLYHFWVFHENFELEKFIESIDARYYFVFLILISLNELISLITAAVANYKKNRP